MDSQSLHLCKPHKLSAILNRSYTLLHSTALMAMIFYRVSSFFYPSTTISTPILPYFLVFASELMLSFLWLLSQAYRWRPISRFVFPERLREDQELPAIDVFICTADPKKEPVVEVMNTVISAMALDYPPEKLSVYLSDDGGSSVTLYAVQEAWSFARWWIPFCRRYGINTRCPKVYFSALEDEHGDPRKFEFVEEREKIKSEYELFKERVMKAGANGGIEDTSSMTGRNHPPVIEVIQGNTDNAMGTNQADMPLLVYIRREKRPLHPHHFKAGALNVLLRVSSIISNAPYLLVLDCDMYCNDPSSARQAMCFHLDPKISPSLAFVQFPQKFHNISKNDIYDAQLRSAFMIRGPGMDGLQGPMLSGTCFYMKRAALFGNVLQNDMDLIHLKQSFGPSNEFVKSLGNSNQCNVTENLEFSSRLREETQFLASCTYEKHTLWGEQIGFLYKSVLEDYFTGFILHCKGWTSIYCNPSRPAFLGSATMNLNDTLIQGTRWNSGLLEVTFSRFCPIVYGLSRMSVLESLSYGCLTLQPFYALPLWCLATIPQLCLLNGITTYPKVSDSWSVLFSFVFLSSLLKQLEEVLSTGGSILTWWNELRIWMIKSITAYFFGLLDAILKNVGMREASFMPTNKVADSEEVTLQQRGKFNFQTSTTFLAPLVTLVVLNMISCARGVAKMVIAGGWDEMFGQVLLSFFILMVNYPIIEGMVMRKDKGGIRPSITLLSLALSMIFLRLGSIVLNFTS